MSRLPTVRVHREDPGFHDMDANLQPASDSKFGFAWPGCLSPHPPLRSDHPPTHPASSEETDSTPTNSQDEAPPHAPSQQPESHLSTSQAPRLSRAFSMPLPSQIAHFQHPARAQGSGSPPTPAAAEVSGLRAQQCQELSRELADSLQTAIQTLLQLSPPQLFDPAKEQFSSYAVQIPTPSVSALLTSMKNLNYMSANMHRIGLAAQDGNSSAEPSDTPPKDEFDVGELLQSVGDSLGGVAAEAEVDLVLHHGDAGIKHIDVKGDECGISYALTHIIHQVLITTRHGDSIEIGLSVTGQPSLTARDAASSYSSSPSSPTYVSSSSLDSPLLDDDGPVICTFDIAHRFFSSTNGRCVTDPDDEPPSQDTEQDQLSYAETRPEPRFDTMILRRLLRHIGGTLRSSMRPQLFNTGRRCELTVTLERGLSVSSLHRQTDEEMGRQLPTLRLAPEPTLKELTGFAETLRGEKAVFHASSQGSFAHHLTRYLTAWGMDISHVPTDGVEEKDPAEDVPVVRAESLFSSSTGSSPSLGLGLPIGDAMSPIVDSASDSPEEKKPLASEAGLSFIIIDDDVRVLRRRLLQHRAESTPNLNLHSRKQRPSLAANHRPRSSPSMRTALLATGAHCLPTPFSSVPIVYFTSLANYKVVKHAIQASFLHPGPPLLPEVIVIPKPAGPRRLLTALHTAVNKPLIDPFFSHIATSPLTSGGPSSPSLNRKVVTPPAGLPRSSRSPRQEGVASGVLPPSSPLALSEGLEYFPDVAVRKLGGNAASGLVIQSPDGRPAGIFFQPQSRASSSSRPDLSAMTMDRERGFIRPGSPRATRGSCPRTISGSGKGDAVEKNDGTVPTPYVKPSTGDKLASTSPSPERPRARESTEFLRSFRGQGRVPTSALEPDKARAMSSAAWIEATQNLAMQNLTLSAASGATAESVTAVQPQTAEPMPPSTRKASQSGIPSPVSRSPSSPSTPENRKSVARRSAQGQKNSVVPVGMKKSKTVGNNIVPPISVLIVEDNAINQTILSTFMRRNKIKYEVAWNGREAVEKWRHGNFHLILMDIQMPVMDGIEATKEIRRLEKLEKPYPFPHSPGEQSRHSAETPDSRPSSASSTPFRSQVIIVALTASSLQSDRVAALAAGCNDFLTKPVTNSWLNDKVIEWGSIKALQMWAELRPEVARNIRHDQEAQAQAVAAKLHVPPASARKLPLSEEHFLPSSSGEPSWEATEPRMDDGITAGRRVRRSSNKDSSPSGSSPERWPVSSDDEQMQDPITEPPAVIQTPERKTFALPEPDLHVVAGDGSLPSFREESKNTGTECSTFLGQRAKSCIPNPTSITSAIHDTPGVADPSKDGTKATGDDGRSAGH